ncbi:MarR family winged helix-turn-helix transcriptional regulator [uncultured Pseudacidovorax sp.]|uniref:MarR family winged helix-turn-helix transcriptional regulator n=1 Tax=uncultured Pseudacidovorax sp. TaxID=679313 RepID=UPI0025F0E4FF|nr:MarR family transcriptional regulator [uncultured Pseudacidovorax sp.]
MDDSTPALPRQRFGMRFVVLARRWRRALDAQLAALGLTDAGWPPLMYLAQAGGGLTQRELAERIGIDGSSLVRLLDQHARAGWIERRDDPQDRRTWRLFLTRDGRAMVRRIQTVLDRVESRMLAGLDDAQLQALLDGFDRIGEGIAAMESGA